VGGSGRIRQKSPYCENQNLTGGILIQGCQNGDWLARFLSSSRYEKGHLFEFSRKLERSKCRQTQALFSTIDSGQPKAAILDGQAEESGNRNVGRSLQQAEASSIGQMHIAEQ